MSIQIKKIGGLQGIKAKLMGLTKIDTMDILEVVSNHYLELLQNDIRSGDLPIAPLREGKYKERKERQYGDVVLVRTGQYVDNLRVEMEENSAIVGAIGGDLYIDDSGKSLEMTTLAYWLESGMVGGGTVPRPHFDLSWDRHKDTITSMMKDLTSEYIHKRW